MSHHTDDVDKTNHGLTPVNQAAADFAGLVGQMLAERDTRMDGKLDAIQKALQDLTNAFLGFNESRRADDEWRAHAEARFRRIESAIGLPPFEDDFPRRVTG